MLLIIEDETLLASLLEEMVEEEYNTTVITSFEDIKNIDKSKYNLVLTDYRLDHDKTGLDVVDEFKDYDIPILLMSGFSDLNDNMISSLFSGFLRKPFHKNELLNELSKYYK